LISVDWLVGVDLIERREKDDLKGFETANKNKKVKDKKKTERNEATVVGVRYRSRASKQIRRIDFREIRQHAVGESL
jgi:hypothetical protein